MPKNFALLFFLCTFASTIQSYKKLNVENNKALYVGKRIIL